MSKHFGIPSRGFPRRFLSKTGLHITLQRLPVEAGQQLIDMYLAFEPRNCFQGLPPLKDAACVQWVEGMLQTGIHVVAISAEPTLVGHAALFPIRDGKCELLVVVCPNFQNLGIGTKLVESCIDLADELHFTKIWLPVDATNVRARHIYRKCGFDYASNGRLRELDMVCDVRRCRPAICNAIDAMEASVPPPHFPFVGKNALDAGGGPGLSRPEATRS